MVDLISNRSIEITKYALDGLMMRQKAITANTANAMSPDYQRKEVEFESQLKEMVEKDELKQYIKILEKQYLPTGKYWMEVYMRFSIPMASFFFVLIGVPLGMQPQRASSSIGLGISIILIFVYYSVMTFMSGLGKGGVIPPLLAAIIPNLLCLIAGVWLMRKKNE